MLVNALASSRCIGPETEGGALLSDEHEGEWYSVESRLRRDRSTGFLAPFLIGVATGFFLTVLLVVLIWWLLQNHVAW